MNETILQFLDLAGATELKNLLVAYVDKQDAASIKGVGLSGNKLSFYKSEPISGATASYEIELPETDLSTVMSLVSGAVENNLVVFGANGQVKDSGKKITDFYLKTDVDSLIAAVEAKISANAKAISDLDSAVDTRISAAKTELNTTITTTKDALQGNIDRVDDKADTNATAIGILDDLGTTQKGDLVSAINEVKAGIAAGGEAGLVTIEESTTSTEYAKVYTIKQGGASVGKINIPKDMVVQSGEVVVNPDGMESGTYIKLVLANATNDVIYVNVGTLVDIYKAEANATQIQLTIDSDTREISAVIVAGSITSAEIANNAIVTAKIADGNVTLAKLSTSVQASLAKADVAAPQSSLDAEIEARGTAISGLDVRITTLESQLEESGSVAEDIADALSEAKTYTNREIKKVTDTIGTVTSGKTVVQMIEESEYDDGEVRSLIASNNTAITNLTNTHNTDKTNLQASINANASGVSENAAAIQNLEQSVSNIQAIPIATITGLFN